MFGITDGQAIADFYDHGHGALGQPAALGAGRLYLVATDFRSTGATASFMAAFCGNTTPCITPRRMWNGFRRRAFIRSIWCWAPCAVDVAALLAGISPEIFIVLGPFNTIASVFVHANLNWTLGPLNMCW